MKNILFVVGNEYHLYSAICMYYKYFSSGNYCFKLIITKRPGNPRIEKSYRLPFDYYVFDDYLTFYDCRLVKNYPDYEMLLYEIFSHVNEFYIYFDFSLLSTKIINWVKNFPSSRIFMVQEGVAGYLYRRKSRIIILKFYITYLYLKYYKCVKNIDFVYQWGRYKKIQELKMFFPEKVKPHIHAPATKLDLQIDHNTNLLIKNIFNFRVNFDPNRKYILYLPIAGARGSMVAKEKEFSIIKKILHLSSKYNTDVIIKTKSGTDSSKYRLLFNTKCKIIDEKVPAELLISDLYNSLIISAFSSASLHDVNNNKHFWIYPILGLKTKLNPVSKNIILIHNYSTLEECLIQSIIL